MTLHASCAARAGDAVLILGPSGAGKSDLVLRLMGRGWDLVADDQVEVSADAEGLFAYYSASSLVSSLFSVSCAAKARVTGRLRRKDNSSSAATSRFTAE